MRVCFQLHVAVEHLDEYTRRHAEVWPEMRQALSDSGWHNYSLFLSPDGTLIGYFECDDLEAVQAAMAATDVNSPLAAGDAAVLCRTRRPAARRGHRADPGDLPPRLTPKD